MTRRISAIAAFVVCAGAATLLFHDSAPRPRYPAASIPGPRARARRHVVSTKAESEALAWAERCLGLLPDRMRWKDDPWEPELTLENVRDKFQAIAEKYGPSCRASCGMGECELRLGDYEQAVKSFSAALVPSPHDRRAAAGLSESRELLRVSHAIEAALPGDESIQKIRRYPRPLPGRSWVALCEKSDPSDGKSFSEHNAPLTLRLFVEQRGGYRCVWSAAAGDFVLSDEDSIASADLYVENLAGGAAPQVVLHQDLRCSPAEPTRLAIYAWKNGKLERVLNLCSGKFLWLEDIRQNGTYQVWTSREIGSLMCHAAQPRWTDVYAWRGGRFRLSDRQYPGAFRRWVGELRETLKTYPHDPDVLAHLAATYNILGKHQDADRVFRTAEQCLSLEARSEEEASRAYSKTEANDSQAAEEDLGGVAARLRSEDEPDLAGAYAIAGRDVRARQLYNEALRHLKHEAAKEQDPAQRADDEYRIDDLRAQMREMMD